MCWHVSRHSIAAQIATLHDLMLRCTELEQQLEVADAGRKTATRAQAQLKLDLATRTAEREALMAQVRGSCCTAGGVSVPDCHSCTPVWPGG